MLRRQPGTKEARYGHLFSGDFEGAEPALAGAAASPSTSDAERMARLEAEVAGLRTKVADLEQQLADFRKQFE
jgi:uncharacterized protein YceH (UPF0502 family)